MRGKIFATLAATALCCAMAWSIPARAANGVVGPGNCNKAGFDSVLASVDASGGGTITFNCGTATIAFQGYRTIAHAVTIDGGGTITFDGGNTSPFFQVFFSANATLRRLTLQHGAYSGGVRALENIGKLTLDRVRVTNNTSTLGPVLNSGTLNVSSSTFSGNAASSSSSGNGGAIENSSGTVNVNASTFNGNGSARNGGAIYSDGVLKVTNSTFSANNATGGGGAIYQTDGAGLDGDLAYVTLVGNNAAYGAGIYKDAGDFLSALTVSRSLLSGNTTGNCDGALTSGGYNLSSDTYCGGAFTATGDLNSQTLAMGPLAGNGGPTQTMLPQGGNPAINHVPSAQCQIPADQRGGGRPSGVGCDSGAVEVGATLDLIFYDGFE